MVCLPAHPQPKVTLEVGMYLGKSQGEMKIKVTWEKYRSQGIET
jgi:hypothetical protein